MAMEKQHTISDVHTRPVTAIGFQVARREVFIGCEDGLVKTFEAESGKCSGIFREHKGWVTEIVYWADMKLMLSSANDSEIIAWGLGTGVLDRVKVGVPVFCMVIIPRRRQLLCGIKAGIRVHALDEEKQCGHFINTAVIQLASQHTDIVRCLMVLDTRIYSAGYDKKLVIYDCFACDVKLHPVFNQEIHNAGITCMTQAVDSENNTWIVTGSFDKSVRIWSVDGKMMHRIDNFLDTVTGLCYVTRNRTLWVAGGAAFAWMYEPRSAIDVTDYMGTFPNRTRHQRYYLQLLRYSPELSLAVASTNRRQLMLWKFNTAGCLTTLTCNVPLESLCYTSKFPILMFSGDQEGQISKWERDQSNTFMYSKEDFIAGDLKKFKEHVVPALPQSDDDKVKAPLKAASSATSRYAYSKDAMPSISAHKHPDTTVLRTIFIESLDYLLAASEDGNIYVWGFDQSAKEVLQSMRPSRVDSLIRKYGVLLDAQSQLLSRHANDPESDAVTNRVAGFVCKYVLTEHQSCVSCLALVDDRSWESTFVLSGGWDRRVCLWDLDTGTLTAVCHPTGPSRQGDPFMICDGSINDIAYSPQTKEFAYASSDRAVYIRKFSTDGCRMFLVSTLVGHDGEVTTVGWNSVYGKWVTGSDDATIRIWNGTGLNVCEQVLNTSKSVTCLCIDQTMGTLVTAVHTDIRVYDCDQYRLVQTNKGHTDSVRSIIHIPERNQYVSCSWDGTIRIWKAWKTTRTKRSVFDDVKKGAGGRTGRLRFGSLHNLDGASGSGSDKGSADTGDKDTERPAPQDLADKDAAGETAPSS